MLGRRREGGIRSRQTGGRLEDGRVAEVCINLNWQWVLTQGVLALEEHWYWSTNHK
jgi:hypothetical protein